MILRNNLIVLFCFISMLAPRAEGVVVTGQTSFTVQIDGKETKLTVADIHANANYDTLEFSEGNKKTHTFGPTWTAFSLNPAKKYEIPTWLVGGNCGCQPQLCGSLIDGCELEEHCESNKFGDVSLFRGIYLWACSTRDHYCWNLMKRPGVWYESRYLSKRFTIALTSYGGPDAPEATPLPGYTIKNSFEGQTYSYNARITDVLPRKQVDLGIYRYLQSEGKILLAEDLDTLTGRPVVTVNYTNSTCPWKDPMYLDVNMTNNTLVENADRTVFRSYIILKKAKKETLTSLSQVDILGIKEPTEWNNEPKFDFLDPCNEQFLTLQKDAKGNIIVEIPPRQKLIYPGIVCIAVNEETSKTRNELVLYELKLGTTEWKASDKFVGALSVDYLSTVDLKITTSSSLTLNVPEATISMEIHDETDPPFLKVTSDKALTCKVFLSKDCTFTLPIGMNGQSKYVTQPIQKSCGIWNENVDYVCDGVLGSFHPPSKYTITPLRNIFEETTSKAFTSNIPNMKDNNSAVDAFWKWWQGLTLKSLWSDILDGLLSLIKWALIIGSAFLAIGAACLMIYRYILEAPFVFLKKLFLSWWNSKSSQTKESASRHEVGDMEDKQRLT